jgi:hypothetical protein
MHPTLDMAKRIQIIIVAFFILAGARILFIYRERNAPATNTPAPPANPNFSADDYVVPTQVHAYDLKSAKEGLAGKTLWVKAGYQVFYFPYASGRVDYNHPTGLLAPLQKLNVTNVVQATPPNSNSEEIAPGVRTHSEQVLIVFHSDGEMKTYAAAIGSNRGGDYTLYINDTFYIEDPHQLYKHWTRDIWNAIDQHQAKPGMNELQVGIALGAGVPQGGGGYGNRTLVFDNNGHPVKVTFARNHATEVQSASGS